MRDRRDEPVFPVGEAGSPHMGASRPVAPVAPVRMIATPHLRGGSVDVWYRATNYDRNATDDDTPAGRGDVHGTVLVA